METFDGNIQDFDNRHAGDKGVHARFYNTPVKDEEASAREGRPMFNDKVFVEIVAAGNANNIVRRKANDEDKRRFHRQYELFLQGSESQLVGTALTEVPWLTRSQVEELAYMRIRTLEALANTDDAMCAKVAGLYDLKKRAAAHLALAVSAAPMEALHLENETLKNQLAALTQTVQEQIQVIKDLKEKK
jgi:hypothetical protein